MSSVPKNIYLHVTEKPMNMTIIKGDKIGLIIFLSMEKEKKPNIYQYVFYLVLIEA